MNLIKRFWLRFWPGFPRFREVVRDQFMIWLLCVGFVSVVRGEFFGYFTDRSTVFALWAALASPFLFFYVYGQILLSIKKP